MAAGIDPCMLIASRPAMLTIRPRAAVLAGAALSAGLILVGTPAWAQPATSADTALANQPAPAALPHRKEAHHAERAVPASMVIRGADTIGLIATLPWWRVDESQPRSESGWYESPILTACDLWLGFPYATADARSLTVRLATAQHASEIELAVDRIRVADPDELNELDLAAPEEPRRTASWGWLQGLLVVLVGAGAAASAARFLMARGSSQHAA
jgi:hypothetical protein